MPKKMDESKLVTLLNSEIENSIGGSGGEISGERQTLLNYYYGEMYGNERDGFSKVVTRDVLETVEWIKPSLLEIFFSGSQVVEFDSAPNDPQGEAQARQETEYCNFIFTKENNGFLEGYNWITDALLQKVGIIKVWRDEQIKFTHEKYSGLNEFELEELINRTYRDAVEVTGHSFNTDGTIDVELTIKRDCKKTVVKSVPPEEFLVSRRARSLMIQELDFCCHQEEKKRSELIAMGYKESVIDELSQDDSLSMNDEFVNRNNKTDEQHSSGEDSDPVYLYQECYYRIDYDGDGYAELRQINKVGKTVLENTEVDHIPFAALCSLPIAHKFSGMCVADLVKDLQLQRSTIMRMFFDGLYQSNMPRLRADPDMVTMSDLLNPAPGQVVRGKQGAIEAIPNQAGEVANNALPALNLLTQVKEDRSGVSRGATTVDADVLQRSTKGAYNRAMDAANQRVSMIARIFAETGFKDLFKLIRELGIKHNDVKDLKIGQEWVQVHPLSWMPRENMTVNVGLGSGNKEHEIQMLTMLMSEQKALMQQGSPMVTPQHLYNGYRRLVELMGYKNVSAYFADPASLPPPQPAPPPPDPMMVGIEKQFEIEVAKLDLKQKELLLKHAKELAEMELKYNHDLGQPGIGAELQNLSGGMNGQY